MAVLLIKPYVDKDQDSIGLSSMGINSFPGTKKILEIPEKYGKYLTGFDTSAYYLDSLDEKERQKEIEKIEADIRYFNDKYSSFKVDDVKITKTKDGEVEANEFYKNMLLEIGAESTILNTANPIDLVKIRIIKTNAKYNQDFLIAPDLRTAMESNRDYKFYIADTEADVEQEVSKRRELNKAVSVLDDISADDKTKFLLVIKYLLPTNKSYSKESDNRLYKRADDYINGLVDGVPVKGGDQFYKNFIKACSTDRDELLKKVLVKYAIYLNVVRANKEKEFIYVKTGQEMGKTPDEIYKYLSNPKNTETYNEVLEDVEKEVRLL